MATHTYTSLVADLKREMDRTDSDDAFVDQLPSVFDRAERRIARELNLAALHVETPGTLTISNNELAKPQNLTSVEYLEVRVTATEWRRLKERPAAWIKEWWPTPTATGAPRYFGLLDKDSFILAPTPDATYPYKLGHRLHAPASFLSGSVATNVLTEECPDLLLAALCCEGARFSRYDRAESDALLAKWEAAYQQIKASLVGTEIGQGLSAFEAGTNVEQA